MADWQGYLRQAHRFWEGAEAAHDPEHASQAVSNAILAAIAANDAVCLYLLGEVSGSGSHAEAARHLQTACKGTRWEREAATHARQFAQILREKNAAQYEGRPLAPETADRIMTQARRFLDWVERVLPPLPLSPTDA